MPYGQHSDLASSHDTAFPDGEQVEVKSRLPIVLPATQNKDLELGLDRTQDFATLQGRTGPSKFSGHVLPDRTGPDRTPFFS